MLPPVATCVKKPAAIIIAITWRWSGASQQAQNVQHPFQCVFKSFWDRNADHARQNRRMQKEVERVNMVVCRSLEMEAIGLNLPLGLAQDDLPPQRLPALCRT